MIWKTSFEVVNVTASGRKSITRYSVHGLFGLVRDESNVCSAAGIGRPSTGIGADQTVIAGG